MNLHCYKGTPGINYCWQCKNENCDTAEPTPCPRLEDDNCYSKSVTVDNTIHSMEYGCSFQPVNNRSRSIPCSTRGAASTCISTCSGTSCNTPMIMTSPTESKDIAEISSNMMNPSECANVFLYKNILYSGCTTKDYPGINSFLKPVRISSLCTICNMYPCY